MTTSTGPAQEWERELADVWACAQELSDIALVQRIDELAARLPAGDAVAFFERGGAQDSTGHCDEAVPLYREALRVGLAGGRRRQACVQLASSLRNLGQPGESVDILTAELARVSDELDDAVRAFLALALIDLGREREAAALALGSLAKHLPRYSRSLANYSAELVTSA